jgi:hypothetical protein
VFARDEKQGKQKKLFEQKREKKMKESQKIMLRNLKAKRERSAQSSTLENETSEQCLGETKQRC